MELFPELTAPTKTDPVHWPKTRTIYRPRGQALEYSELATNPYRGCGHACAYCYVPRVTRQPRSEFDAGSVLRKNYMAKLLGDARTWQRANATGQVMLSFTTDPYPPAHHTETRTVLKILREHGLSFCTLSKGGKRALRDIDLFRPNHDAYAATLTSLDTAFSRKWERNAADPDDRIATLKTFHEAGIFTWVSLEPTLDVATSLEIVHQTYEYVDLYKIGRVNYIGLTKTTDWEDYTLRMVDVLCETGAQYYFKRDLQPYLPPGYPNQLRHQQNNGPTCPVV